VPAVPAVIATRGLTKRYHRTLAGVVAALWSTERFARRDLEAA
jgi:hypothetical protein